MNLRDIFIFRLLVLEIPLNLRNYMILRISNHLLILSSYKNFFTSNLQFYGLTFIDYHRSN